MFEFLSCERRTTANMMPTAGWPKSANTSTYDCEGNLVFKEFKEMALRGGIVAPINKERLETELGSVSALSARAGVMIGRATACSPASCAPTEGGLVRLRRPRPPHPQDIRRNHHAVRVGRQRAAARMNGRK